MKAGREDEITRTMLPNINRYGKLALLHIINGLLEAGQISEERKQGLIIRLLKTGW